MDDVTNVTQPSRVIVLTTDVTDSLERYISRVTYYVSVSSRM